MQCLHSIRGRRRHLPALLLEGVPLLPGPLCLRERAVPTGESRNTSAKSGRELSTRTEGGSPGYYLWVNVGVAAVLNDGFRSGRSEAVSLGTGKNRKFPEIR